jgi:hypothetical protein
MSMLNSPRRAAMQAQSEELRTSANTFISEIKHGATRDVIRRTVLVPLDEIDHIAIKEWPAQDVERWMSIGDALLESAGFTLQKWQSLEGQYGKGLAPRG